MLHSETHGVVGVIPMADFDDVLDRLLRRRGELVSQLQRVDDAIRALRDAAELVGDERASSLRVPSTVEREAATQPETRERNIVPPADIAKYAREILLDFGQPMKRGRLVRALESKGFPLAGTDKNKNLGTILWRHRDQFVNLPNLGYWPRGVALSGVYDPATHHDNGSAEDD